jgi:hypothetical protein
MRAQEGLGFELHLESSVQLGWNVVVVSKSLVDAAGNTHPAAQIAESVFVVVTSPSTYHHHGLLLSDFDFSNFPAQTPSVPSTPINPAFATSDSVADIVMMHEYAAVPVGARAVFEALAALANRTIVSFGDSVERNIINDVAAICQQLAGAFKCIKMPNVAEPGRGMHVLWPSLGLNWITVSFPGVSYCKQDVFSRLVPTQCTPQVTRWVQPAFNFEGGFTAAFISFCTFCCL